MTTIEPVLPDGWAPGRGYAHCVRVLDGGVTVHVAGQFGVGDDEPGDFASQWERALGRVVEAVQAAGGQPDQVAALTVYVTDLAAYRAAGAALGDGWRAAFGRWFPAITMVEVSGLVDPRALVEIAAVAHLPG